MSWRTYQFGCTPTMSSGQRICHDVGNLAVLHQDQPGKGCAICHREDGSTAAEADECLTCHGTGWYDPATSGGTITRPGSDFSTSGAVTAVGGSGADAFSTLLTNDGGSSYLAFASTNAEALFGRGTWWLNPNTTTITNVAVQFRAMKLAAGTTSSRMTVVLNVGGTQYLSTAAVSNPSTAAYTLYTHTFATNPRTGLAWTPEDLNNPDSPNGLRAFGVRQTLADTASIGVTEVLLKVTTPATNYTAPPRGGGQAHHYGAYERSPQTVDGGPFSAVYYQYCLDRCHAYPNYYNYIGDVENMPTYSPYRAYEGGWMWSSLMNDTYGTSPTDRSLTLETITLPDGTSALDFMTNWRLNNAGTTSSVGTVEVSTDGGSTWTALTGTVGGEVRSSITENATVWVPAHYDLSAYAGQDVVLRFRYVEGTDGAAGWAFDNLTVSGSEGVLFSDDAETLKPEWNEGDWRRIPFALRAWF